MVHVGINFSEFLGMKTLLKLGFHTWVSLLTVEFCILPTHTHFIYILVFGLYYIKV